MGENLRLTFNTTINKFVLRGTFTDAEISVLRRKLWFIRSHETDVSSILETTDIKEAARFKLYADKISKRVFNRIFIKYYESPACGLPAFLEDYQNEGVLHILTRSRAYLAHAPGAGKTPQFIVAAVLAMNGKGQSLIICPPTLTENWAREILKFSGFTDDWYSYSVLPETAKREQWDSDADFLVVPDSMISKQWVLDILLAKRFVMVGVDEAHRFKEDGTRRAYAFYGAPPTSPIQSTGLFQDAKHAVLLSGTPMPNRPMELWSPLSALVPEEIDFMSKNDFGFKYCGARINDRGNWEYRGASNQDELREVLRRNFMHVVTEEQIGLAERTRSMVYMNKDTRTAEMKAWEKKNLSRINFADISDVDSVGEIAEHRRLLGMSKIKWVVQYLNEIMGATNEQALIFAWHRDVVEGLATLLADFKPVVVMGGINDKVIEKGFAEFQAGRRRLIVGNILKMSEGHNLQAASLAFFAEWSWTDSVNLQCEKRGHRKGNTKKFWSRYLVLPNSMDEIQLRSCFNKADQAQRIIG